MKIKLWIIIVSFVLLQGCTAALVSELTPNGGGSSGLSSLLVLLGINRPSGGSSGYSLSSAFSYNNNPNGVWSYGWKSTATGTFTVYTLKRDSGGLRSWYDTSDTNPSFANNYSSSTLYGIAPGEFSLHPGSSGQISVLRWTAPQAGTISIKGSFKAGDTGAVDVYVLKNSTTLFSKTSTLITESYDQTTTVAIGDTVDFQVGYAGNYTNDSTPIDGVITYTTATTGTGTTCTAPTGAQLPIKTGQTTSYATGDDGQYQIGRARTYTDNGDGTITENSSCLVWQKCSAGQSGTNCSSGSLTSYTWTSAGTYCSSLSLAGKTWRLPTINELANLTDYSSATVNFIFFPNTATNNLDRYWSSSTYAPSPLNAWNLYFINGLVAQNSKTDDYYVRCVSGQ